MFCVHSWKQTTITFSGDHLLLSMYPCEQKSRSHGTDVAVYNLLTVT